MSKPEEGMWVEGDRGQGEKGWGKREMRDGGGVRVRERGKEQDD